MMEAVSGSRRREAQAIGLISSAHLLSHLYMLPLAPLLLAIESDIGISKVEWGFALAAYAITTGVLQTPMGLLVERIGGRKVLVGGLFVTAGSFVLIGLYAADFWSFVLLMALAGVGNSVFHPADYSLLSASVDDQRIGKAFSVHALAGNIGMIMGPIVTSFLQPYLGWRGAIIAIGVLGVATTVALLLGSSVIVEGNRVKKSGGVTDSIRELVRSPPVMLFFAFYVCTSAANIGITQFSVAAFQNMYGLTEAAAVIALTAFQIGTLMLVLPGGFLADKTTRYDMVLVVGFGGAAIFTFLCGTGWLPFWAVVTVLCIAGGMRGGVNAARDVSVRRVASHLPIGTVFAFISTGFLLGQAVGGPIYGWLFDNYAPEYIFYVSAAISVLGIATVVINPGTRQKQAVAE